MHNPGMYGIYTCTHVCYSKHRVICTVDMCMTDSPCVYSLTICTASEDVPSFETISAGTPRSRKRYHGVRYAFLLMYSTYIPCAITA